MIRLYQGSGSGEISFVAKGDESDWAKYRIATIKLLRARNRIEAADSLTNLQFILNQGTNVFGDKFNYLSAECDLDMYVKLAEEEGTAKAAKYEDIANTISEIGPYIRFIIVELRTDDAEHQVISSPKLTITAEAVKEALADAELLLKRSPSSAIDRIHTVFHGYLLEQCRKNNISHNPDDSITFLFKQLCQSNSRFKDEISKHEEINKICKALATIIDSLNPIRNQHSRAHPNDIILGDDESFLVINSIRSLLHYLNAKL